MEQLELQVDSAEMVFLSWNLDSLKRADKAIKARIKRAEDVFTSTGYEFSMEEGNLIADFKAAGKAFKNMDRSVPQLIQEIQYSRQQLATLKKDLDKNALDKAQVTAYLADEEKAVTALKTSITQMQTGFERARERVNRLGPEVDALIEKLEEGS